MNAPGMSQKILSTHQLLLLNLKNFRTTFFQSTSQQLKAAQNSTKLESKNEKIKQKQQQQIQ